MSKLFQRLYKAFEQNVKKEEVLAIRRIFSLVDMITNSTFPYCPNVLKNGAVQQ